jgi:zinc/manganese transport system permease protein
MYRPLMLSSVMPDVAEARGVRSRRMEVAFLLVVALTTTMAVPVVGALLIFSLLISPAAAARSFTNKPITAMALSIVIALGTVWTAIALSFLSNLPIGFFVGSIGAVTYAAGRGWAAWRRNRHASPRMGAPLPRAVAG